MKILLFSRPDNGHNAGELRRLVEALDGSGLDYAVNGEFADVIERTAGVKLAGDRRYGSPEEGFSQGASVAVSYGGDGTFLDCVRLLGRFSLPVLGINSGRLGFLANVPLEGMPQAFADIRDGRFTVQARTLLHAGGDFPIPPEYPYAFNEFSIQRSGTAMLSVETYVNDEMVATYWSDGVLLSTPSGSTAYALSVGGPVVAPGCECFLISPIAPHNLTMRPVVIPDDSVVTFRVRTRDGHLMAALDNISFKVNDGASFRVAKAESSVFLVKLQNISFYDTLRNKMLWGIDRRDDPGK